MIPMATPITEFERFEDPVPVDVLIVNQNSNFRLDLGEKLNLPPWDAMQAGGGTAAFELVKKHGIEGGVLLLGPQSLDIANTTRSSRIGFRKYQY